MEEAKHLNTQNVSESNVSLGNEFSNISSMLAQMQQLENEKLSQLDAHMDFYSRKIINGVQQLWKSAQATESYLREALEMANKTRSFIKLEFRRLQVNSNIYY